MSPELVKECQRVKVVVEKTGLGTRIKKELPYGVQLRIFKGKNEIPLNIYYSKKRGISTVIGGTKDNPLRAMVSTLFKNKMNDQKWEKWVGTDESGKGDFFGPLVVAGFACDKKISEKLSTLGVKDSKLLSDSSVKRIAKKLTQNFPHKIKTIQLNPPKYNQLYRQFTERGKKLNEMLAWMHTRAVVDMKQVEEFDGVVIDKFTSRKVIKGSLAQFRDIDFILKIRAESDIAVAAASILARAGFLAEMEKLSATYKMRFPKGAGRAVERFAIKFVQSFGASQMQQVAKLHFKTYRKVVESGYEKR